MINWENKIRNILLQDGEFRNVEELKIDDDLIDFGLDSLKLMYIVISIECEFSVKFDDDELIANRFNTIQKIYDQICLKQASRKE